MADGKGGASGTAPTGARLKPPPVYRITLVQLAVLGFLSIVTLALADTATTVSLVAGACCSALPQAWFAVKMFGRGGRRGAEAAGVGYSAAAGKFLLSAVGFALVFALLRPVVPLAVFGGFAAMLLVQVAGGVTLLRRGQSDQ
ncbi:MAG: ATP synthase subunit I [Pseudohaliea sp.]